MHAVVSLIALLHMTPSFAAHAYAQFGDIKYPAGFAHFDWVNPNAPKGGELRLTSDSTDSNFDKYNPFTLKGSAAPGLISSDPSGYAILLFETLLTTTMDEPTTAYGLLAEDVTVASDNTSATFRLNPKARFHDGSPVLAKDVKYSFERLTSPEADPKVRSQFTDVLRAVVVTDRVVRFDFKHPSAVLPLLVGAGMHIFSHKWGAGKAMDKVILDIPIASGPYKIGKTDFGRDITYDRDPNYWGKDLNVRRGLYNFDHITFKVYKDTTAQTEAFMAGEFDFTEVFRARDWARTFAGPKFRSGKLIKQVLPQGNAANFQAFMVNARRDKFKDPRVRQAIGLAMDYEWLNQRYFYNSYVRMTSFFASTDFEARGLPGPDELALLTPMRDTLPAAVFDQAVPLPPSTKEPNSLRGNLRLARQLLTEAGWTYRDNALRNARGDAFVIEFLEDSPSFGRVIAPISLTLNKLGIQSQLRIGDAAMVKKRRDSFDFDITSMALVGSEAPSKELVDRYSSKAATTEGSYNLAGIRNAAADKLIDMAASARTRPELVTRLRALDRVLRHGYYVIPHWYSPGARVSYPAHRFGQPAATPRYFQAASWALASWWTAPKEGAKQ